MSKENTDVTAKTTQTRFRKSEGGLSKAEQTRAIIAEMNGQDQKAIVGAIQERLGFSRPMARHYFYCNSKKSEQAS